jgi:hypothetical protein
MSKRRRADGPEEQPHSEVQQQQQQQQRQQQRQQQPAGLSKGEQQQFEDQDGDAQLAFNQLSGVEQA